MLLLVFALEDGEADVELHGQDAGEEHADAADDLCHDGVGAQAAAYPVGKAAHDAGHGVDVFAEYEGDLIDEHVAQHSTCRTGKGTHDGGYPEGEAGVEGLLYTYYGEEGKTDGVEEEEGVVHTHQILAEDHHPQQGKGGDDEVDGIVHPEGGDVEQEVTDGTTTDGGDKAYDIGSKEIELLG